MSQNHNSISVMVRAAHDSDIAGCKAIADQQREALGFLVGAVFSDAVRREQLLVATDHEQVLGFVRYNHRRRGDETAIYDISVDRALQRRGIGRMLVQSVIMACQARGRVAIILRCPEELPANDFYQKIGFQRMCVESGRRRQLVVWRLPIGIGLCDS